MALIVGIPIVMALSPSKPVPAISQSAIDTAVNQMMFDPQVLDATVVIDGRDVGLVLVVRRATSPEYGRQLGANFARQLATLTGHPPSKDSLGELWSHYDMQVIVALDADIVLTQGAKARTAAAIRW